MIKVCPACSSTWAGGIVCEDCGATLRDPYAHDARTLPGGIWRYIRLQYGARRGMIVRVVGILLGPVTAALCLRAAAGSDRPWSIVLALAALPLGFFTWYVLHVGAGRAVKIWVLRRGQLNRKKLARALARKVTRGVPQ